MTFIIHFYAAIFLLLYCISVTSLRIIIDLSEYDDLTSLSDVLFELCGFRLPRTMRRWDLS